MDPIWVFLIAGTFAMSGALGAAKLLKLPAEEVPFWAREKQGKTKVLLGGNLFGLVLVAAFVYGVYHLTWWVPIICLFISFPVLHVLILERILGPAKCFMFSGFIALASVVLLVLYW